MGGNLNMFKNIFLYIIIFALLFVTGCSAEEHVDKSSDAKNDYDEQMIEPNNALGFDLLHKVEPNEDDNIFISPTSALIALAMVLNGAEGATKNEIIEVLAQSNIAIEDVNRASAALIEMIEKDSDAVELAIANSIWLNENFHFTDEFTKNTVEFFQAETTAIDVNNDQSVDKINKWVSEATNHKIAEIIEAPLDPNLAAIVINALYFNGKWQYEFNKELTEELPFFAPDTEIKIPMMVLEEELAYIDADDFQAVKLPYGKGEMHMHIFLPKDMDEFTKELTVENWQSWQTEFEKTNGTVILPKFKLEYETELNQALQHLGMELAFDPESADFSKMIKEEDPLWIDKVKQKTYIDVNEEGTEAAAVTSVEIETTSLIIEEAFHMEVNRPFFIAITDEETQTILFMGMIKNLEQE